MSRHFFRSSAKLFELVFSSRSTARFDIMTSPAEGEADQPFCGAEISTSTPVAFMSIHAQPEAMQSSTSSAPTSCAASARAVTYSSGRISPAEVSTCGANTTSGLVSRIFAVTSSIGAGAKGACAPLPVWRAMQTVVSAANFPASKIWLQR